MSSFSLATLFGARTTEFQSSGLGSDGQTTLRTASRWPALGKTVEALVQCVVPAHLHVPEPDVDAMLSMGERMLRTARRGNQPLTMLVMQLPDLPELEVVFGSDAAEEAIDETMTHLVRLAARSGFAVRTAADVFTLLMPNTDAGRAMDELRARLGRPCCIDFELEGEEIMLVPEVLARTVGDSESVEQVYRAICRDIDATRRKTHRQAGGGRRKREVCTMPVELCFVNPQAPANEDWPETIAGYHPDLPPTMALSLSAR